MTVKNCELRNFNDAIRIERSHRNTFSNNRASDVNQGFTINGSDGNELVANSVAGARDWFTYYLLGGSDDNVLRDNVATDSAGVGFLVSAGTGNTFDGNTARDGAGAGFGAHPGAVDNTFSGNSSIDNHEGFADQTRGGTGDAGTDNHYVGNTCSGNRGGASSPWGLCSAPSAG